MQNVEISGDLATAPLVDGEGPANTATVTLGVYLAILVLHWEVKSH